MVAPSEAPSDTYQSSVASEVTMTADSASAVGGRAAARRSGPRAVRGHEERWAAEVARGLGCSQGRSQTLDTRGLRNEARQSMKSTGSRLTEFAKTGGSCITEEDVSEAVERALQRRLAQKKQAMEAEAAKTAERAAKMAAKRSKAKQVQLRHELRIHEAEAKQSALAAQAARDKEVLRDIVTKRQQEQRLLAEKNVQDDSLECVMQWALPQPRMGSEATGPEQVRDQIRDDKAAMRLMGMRGDESHDDDTVLRLMQKGSEECRDDDTALRLMKTLLPDSDEATVQRLMKTQLPDSDEATVQRLMVKASRAEDIRNESAALLMGIESAQLGSATIRGVTSDKATHARDDEAFRLLLDSAATQDEARINANALRLILGGTVDPVTRLAHLARTRPKAGRSRERADAAQAVRDLQVLSNLIEQSDLDADTQAWKDVGAIHMLMNDIPGPDPEKRKRLKQLQANIDDSAQATIRVPPPPLSAAQTAGDVQAVQRLLGQPALGNMLQPPALSGAGALERLIGPPSPLRPTEWRADTKIIQNLMSPRGYNSLQPSPASYSDDIIVQQLMSPSVGVVPHYALAGSNAFNQRSGLAASNVAQAARLGYHGAQHAPALMKHDAAFTPGLMGILGAKPASTMMKHDGAVVQGLMGQSISVPEAVARRDADALLKLLQ